MLGGSMFSFFERTLLVPQLVRLQAAVQSISRSPSQKHQLVGVLRSLKCKPGLSRQVYNTADFTNGARTWEETVFCNSFPQNNRCPPFQENETDLSPYSTQKQNSLSLWQWHRIPNKCFIFYVGAEADPDVAGNFKDSPGQSFHLCGFRTQQSFSYMVCPGNLS